MFLIWNNLTTYFIGINCDLKVAEEREILRGDKSIGLARAQTQKVHQWKKYYDLEIDSSKTSPFQSAQQILQFIEKNPQPKGFRDLFEEFKS